MLYLKKYISNELINSNYQHFDTRDHAVRTLRISQYYIEYYAYNFSSGMCCAMNSNLSKLIIYVSKKTNQAPYDYNIEIRTLSKKKSISGVFNIGICVKRVDTKRTITNIQIPNYLIRNL